MASAFRITSVLIFTSVFCGCASQQPPQTWMRSDGKPVDGSQLEADKTICRDEMEQAERVTEARALTPIYLPGQESPFIKVYNGCMGQHGYLADK
jgi:hypothetical protein